MKIAIALCAMLALAAASPLVSEWDSFKRQFDKSYESQEEEIERHQNFEDTLAYIRQHNYLYSLGLTTFQVGVNQFADWTTDEVNQQMNRLNVDLEREPQTVFTGEDVEDLPDKVDWRMKGSVTPVKNQGQCGSCWAFSATGSLEGAHQIKTGSLVSLSEQQLMDCSRSYHNYGCQGGLMDRAFSYIIANHGIDTEASYPYKARNGQCHYNSNNIGATMSSYTDVARNNEMALQKAIATVGPISVAIDASHRSFQNYRSGVYYEPACTLHLDHGVLAVGYGALNSQQYYIVKNSWGSGWGNKGYIWMSRNRNNNCGIAEYASFPIV